MEPGPHRVDRGVPVAAPVALGLPSTALAESRWLKAESRSFALFGNEGEKTLREMARDLEDFDGLLRPLHGMGDAPPVRRLPPRSWLIFSSVRASLALSISFFSASFFSASLGMCTGKNLTSILCTN